MKRAIFSVLLGLLGLGILFTSAALAAPGQSLSSAAEPAALFQATITPTTEITSTTSQTQPVAAAIAAHFSGVFSTPTTYAGIMALHEEGLGFGVIAKAYFAAQKLGIDPQVLLDEFAAGMGWGEIMKENGLHPGQGRGSNLGAIMSGHTSDETLGASGGRIPPGQLKKSNGQLGADDQADGGRGKDKDKDKDKGNNGKGKNK